MAGPAIRAWELAGALSGAASVTLASTQPVASLGDSSFHVCSAATPKALIRLAQAHDVIVVGGLLLARYPVLARLGKFIVLDLYDPFLLEDLELLKDKAAFGSFLYHEHHRKLEWQMRQADFMICASDRQRDYWLGRLCALARLTPKASHQDPSFERLIDCVPFGLSNVPPKPDLPKLRGVYPGIDPGDRILLWGGGIWDWLDPLTPIRAMGKLGQHYPSLKMVFLAGRSPNPTTPEMPMAQRARMLAAELGVLGRNVIFYDKWVPYAERGSLLLEADAGITAHFHQLETRFSFRTRVLDYLWAGLPILATRGDSMADLVSGEGLGLTCDYESVSDWERAIGQLMADTAFREGCREQITKVRGQFAWNQAAAPLIRYVENPYHTRLEPSIPGWMFQEPLLSITKAALALKDEGWAGLAQRLNRRFAQTSSN